MAARWQQWMPLNINKLRGSMFFKALPDAGKVGYLFLLMAQWETDDGALPSDPLELAVLSGLGEKWDELGPRILRKFQPIEGGKIRNGVLHEEWLEAKRVYEARRNSAKHTNARKPEQSDAVTATVTDTVTVPVTATVTGTHKHKQEQEHKEQLQKPSRRQAPSDEAKHSADPRHVACKERIFAAYRHKNGGADPDWDGREGKALGMLLRAQPQLNAESINPLLAHWARSDINHADRPSIWIPKLSSFRIGPIDRFNKPKETSNGQQRAGKGHSIVQAAESAIRDLAGEAVGDFGDGETGQRRFGDVEVLRNQPLGLPAAGSAKRD